MGKVFSLVCIIIGSFLFYISAVAGEPDALTGRLGVGLIVIDNGNNLNPSGSGKYIANLDSAADRKTTVVPVLMPAVNWDAGKPGNFKFYFGTEPPIDEVGGFALNVGGSYNFPGMGLLDTSLFFTPFEEAWENPYVTGVKREKTSTSKYGLKVAFNRIMGSGLRVNAVYMNDDVDDDIIGGLIPDMERDGAIYALNVNYSFYVTETLELRPRIGIRKGDYKGESNAFIKYKADFEIRYREGRLMVTPRIFYSHSDYDKVNPIFAETRENNSYGMNVMTTYMQPFCLSNWSLQVLAGYSRGDSNIDFYDTEGFSLGTFASYQF